MCVSSFKKLLIIPTWQAPLQQGGSRILKKKKKMEEVSWTFLFDTEYAISWKSKGVYNPKLIALNSDFLPNLKYLKKGLKFNNNPIIKI